MNWIQRWDWATVKNGFQMKWSLKLSFRKMYQIEIKMRLKTKNKRFVSYHVRPQIQKTDLESIQPLLMLGNMNQSNYMNLYQTMNRFFELILNLWRLHNEAIFDWALIPAGGGRAAEIWNLTYQHFFHKWCDYKRDHPLWKSPQQTNKFQLVIRHRIEVDLVVAHMLWPK